MKKFLSGFIISLAVILCSTHVFADTHHLKKIALLGDSMTWIGGDSCQNPRGWSHYLKESGLADQIDVYARSGATWTNTSKTRHNPAHYSETLNDDNVIYNQVVRLIDATADRTDSPDAIIIFAGANDAWFSDRRPGIFNSASSVSSSPPSGGWGAIPLPTTLYGSVNLVCDMLKAKFPSAYIVAVTPVQMTKTDAETVHKVSDIIEKAALEKECSVLRADKEVGITHDRETKALTYTSDGVHTNPAGARLIADFILPRISPQPPKGGVRKPL